MKLSKIHFVHSLIPLRGSYDSANGNKHKDYLNRVFGSHTKVRNISLIFLLLGCLNYFVFNSNILLFDVIGLSKVAPNIKNVPTFFTSYCSDILFSVFVFLNTLYLRATTTSNSGVYFLLLFPIFFEISQEYIPNLGTFDIIDLVIFLLPLSFFIIKYSNLLIVIVLLGTFGSAANKNQFRPITVKTESRKGEHFTKSMLKDYFSKTSEPSIVIRIPKSSYSITSNSNSPSNSSEGLYNSLEKEFLKNDFKIRDRALYEKVAGYSTNYKEIRKKTNTDLIVELVSKTKFQINTNKYTDHKQREKLFTRALALSGDKYEFKVIMVETNEVVGTYTYYHVPCVNGCTLYVHTSSGAVFTQPIVTKPVEIGYEQIIESNWDVFAKFLAKDLIYKMSH